MAYPPPPGTNSLPARPPASSNSNNARSSFKPAFSPTQHQPSTQSYSAAPRPGPQSYGPSAPPSQYGASYSSYPGSAPGAVNSTPSYQSYPAQQSYSAQPQSHAPPHSYGAQSYGGQQQQQQQAYAAPQIRNPFPMPGNSSAAAASSSDYDPEMAAQIAQWQSAYSGQDAAAAPTTLSISTPAPEPVAAATDPDKKKTVVRAGGGKKWTDDSLLEWDPSHLRLFVGNLAGETTDESLLKAFARWKSVQKARVVRDKRSTKSKGFGFVSFSDADDFFQAAKEMNGKYIQSHPVVVRKANTEIKVTNVRENNKGGKWNKKNKGNQSGKGNGGGSAHDNGAAAYEPSLGPVSAHGVTKPGQKTKNGLRLLG